MSNRVLSCTWNEEASYRQSVHQFMPPSLLLYKRAQLHNWCIRKLRRPLQLVHRRGRAPWWSSKVKATAVCSKTT